MKNYKSLFFLLAFFFLLSSFLSINSLFAHETEEDLYQNFTVKYVPHNNIREGELIKFFVNSESFNLSKSLITWSVNNVKTDEGIGRTTFETNAGRVGKSIVVKVKVKNDIFEEAKTITITPNTTFILYEGSDSYVPPFYKGRALPSKEGGVRLAAISFQNGEISDFQNKKNNYDWQINDKNSLNKQAENQIIHKTTASFVDNLLDVKVRKSDNVGNKIADSYTKVIISDVDPIIYKTNENKLNRQELKINERGNNFYFYIEPYFFSSNSRYDQNLVYNWTVDGEKITPKKPWFINVKGIKEKISELTLVIKNTKKVTQEFERTYKLNFE